eukprot:CAMPEP_0197584030 /NCGR_PEP_ID=MMETSP1326-20131121/6763_1 /TAXON_ID=1155430 /ORGANISM="Genus nov. species nov., Strain RCC2288" /LENGTH=347 /DNA_ID=CAMNT_0043148331 /DNA_START=437 /DNA_END=1477 /DNA_ORIENTATION=+
MASRTRNVDKRGDIYTKTKVMQRFCGLGHLRGVDIDLKERKRATKHLRLIFGDTFTEGAYFYANPDVHQFMAVLLYVASAGRVRVDADTRRLFSQSANGKFHVNEAEMLKLGCTKAQLFETLRRTPGADLKFRHANAAPLLLLLPNELPINFIQNTNNATAAQQPATLEVSNAALPVPVSPVVAAAAPLQEVLNNGTGTGGHLHHPTLLPLSSDALQLQLPDGDGNNTLDYDDIEELLTEVDEVSGYSGDLYSVTSSGFSSGLSSGLSGGGDGAVGDAALADCFTSDAPLDLGGPSTGLLTRPFTESLLETSELDDTARRLLLAEHELQATQHRIRLLLLPLGAGDP